jgi:beta-lactamase regulating signal transducer with metallopeptidase domain
MLARFLLILFRRQHCQVNDAGILALAGSVARRLQIRLSIVVLEAQGLLGPAAFGTLRPTIVMPAGFGTAFTPAQQEAMLAHELAHLAANDPGWHLLAIWSHRSRGGIRWPGGYGGTCGR